MASTITAAYHTIRENKRHNEVMEGETNRHNLVTEAQETRKLDQQDRSLDQYDRNLDQQLNIANADRQSREKISALDRSSRQNIADLDRYSRERVAAADRLMKQDIANRDRVSRERISDKERANQLRLANINNVARVKLQDDQQDFLDYQRIANHEFERSGFIHGASLSANAVGSLYKAYDLISNLIKPVSIQN